MHGFHVLSFVPYHTHDLAHCYIRKHWNAPQAPFAHTKAKKSSFAPEEKTSDSKNFMFGGQWSCMMPHMLLYSNSLLC